MREFIAIDFETGNPKRVSACALGYARVVNGQIIEANGYLIKPVGGHASFQSKIHGLKDEHTFDKPDFGRLFPKICDIFQSTLVAHSLFDQQVLMALSDHFGLGLKFEYFDTSTLAKQRLPELKDHKLKTLAKHFGLPKFQHHDAREDAIACASICLKLHEVDAAAVSSAPDIDEIHEFKGLVSGILADDEVNYKEAYELLYWLEDHRQTASQFPALYATAKKVLEDNKLDSLEADIFRRQLGESRQELYKNGI
jgi:DNA polymerase-3 subunit epsilon